MGQGARIGDPTADGACVMTGVPNVLFGGLPVTGLGHATLGRNGFGEVKSGSSTVYAGGVPVARAVDDKHLAPSPSHAGAGVPPVLDAETAKSLHEALVKGFQQIKDRQAKQVKITNDPKGRMPDEIIDEEHGYGGRYGIELNDYNGDGVVDNVKYEGALVEVGGKQIYEVGQGGIGVEEDLKLGSLEFDGTLTPEQQAFKLEAAGIDARIGALLQDPNNANNSFKAGFSYGFLSGQAHAAGGQVLAPGAQPLGALGGADASVVSAKVDAALSVSILDVVNGTSGISVFAAVSKFFGYDVKAAQQAALGSLAERYKDYPSVADGLRTLKDGTIELHGSAEVSGGSLGGSLGGRGYMDKETGRATVEGEGEIEYGVGIDLKGGASIGMPTRPLIETKKKEGEGAHPIVKGERTIIVGG